MSRDDEALKLLRVMSIEMEAIYRGDHPNIHGIRMTAECHASWRRYILDPAAALLSASPQELVKTVRELEALCESSTGV